MSKAEFLSILRGQLTGQIPTSEVASQVNYYEAYIDGQIGNGVSEEQAVEELGDPRLIAKTLIDSTNRAAEEAGYDGPYRSSTDTYDDSDGINSGIFGNSAGNSERDGYSGGNGNRFGGYGEDDGEADRAGTQSGGMQIGGAGCGVIIFIAVILLILVAALVFSLIRFSIRNFGSILLIGAVVAGVIVLVRYIGRR